MCNINLFSMEFHGGEIDGSVLYKDLKCEVTPTPTHVLFCVFFCFMFIFFFTKRLMLFNLKILIYLKML